MSAQSGSLAISWALENSWHLSACMWGMTHAYISHVTHASSCTRVRCSFNISISCGRVRHLSFSFRRMKSKQGSFDSTPGHEPQIPRRFWYCAVLPHARMKRQMASTRKPYTMITEHDISPERYFSRTRNFVQPALDCALFLCAFFLQNIGRLKMKFWQGSLLGQ